MDNNALAAATVNTLGGFVVGAWLIQAGFPAYGVLVIVAGLLAGATVLGSAMRGK